MQRDPHADVSLRRAIGRAGFFALAFGAIVGSGWIVVMGDWLRAAGPGGTAIGFSVGALAMTGAALCYGELAARSPTVGGEFLYVLNTFGKDVAFWVGWFLSLYGIAVCAFEAIALGWLFRTLVPGVALPALYAVRGLPVTLDGLIVGGVGALLVGALHSRGAVAAIRFQSIATYGFIALSVGLIACGLSLGHFANAEPLFPTSDRHSWLIGAAWVFSGCAFFLNGWQSALHAIEERDADTSVASAIRAMVAALLVAAAFYVAMVWATATSTPWTALIRNDLPAVFAFAHLTENGVLGTVVLVGAIVSLTKTWTAIAWVATRLLLAQARHGFLPSALVIVDPVSGAPRRTIALVTALTLAGIALGKGGIVPLVNMVATCLALSIIVCILALLRQRRLNDATPSFSVPGGRPTIWCSLLAAVVMIFMAVAEPWINASEEVPLEWILLTGWGATGCVVWTVARRRRIDSRAA